MTTQEFVKSGKYLPDCLRDFHDQKDLFRLVHSVYGRKDDGYFKYHDCKISWVQGQCYVIDWFLWFMAQRGYTLQRSRKKNIDFKDLQQEIEDMKLEDIEYMQFRDEKND